MLRSRTFKSTSIFPSAQSVGVARLLRALGESARQSAWHVRGCSNGARGVVNRAHNPRLFRTGCRTSVGIRRDYSKPERNDKQTSCFQIGSTLKYPTSIGPHEEPAVHHG